MCLVVLLSYLPGKLVCASLSLSLRLDGRHTPSSVLLPKAGWEAYTRVLYLSLRLDGRHIQGGCTLLRLDGRHIQGVTLLIRLDGRHIQGVTPYRRGPEALRPVSLLVGIWPPRP